MALPKPAAAYGTDLLRYLVVPEAAVLLSKVTALCKRLFVDTLWNTCGQLNVLLPQSSGGFCDRSSARLAVCGTPHAQAAQAGGICRQPVPSPWAPHKRRTAG